MSDEERPEAASESEGNGPEAPEANGGAGADPPADPLEAAKQESQRLKDQLLRTAADFDNFRKRSRREVLDAEKRAREELLRDLLPVFDNLERGAAHAETATDVQSLSEGMRMVLRQFGDTLGRMGIERIPTVGKPFDPAVHEAIQHLETADFAPGIVAAEIQGGYRTAERLVRPALVVVAKGRPQTAPDEGGDGVPRSGHSGDDETAN